MKTIKDLVKTVLMSMFTAARRDENQFFDKTMLFGASNSQRWSLPHLTCMGI